MDLFNLDNLIGELNITEDDLDKKGLLCVKNNMISCISLARRLALVLDSAECFDDYYLAREIEENCYRVLACIVNIDELARLDNFKRTDFNLRLLMEDLGGACISGLRKHSAKVTFECEKDIYVCTDINRLMMCILNLVVNSVVHLPLSDGEIKVKAKKLGDSAMITVSDNGYGASTSTLVEYLNSPTHRGGLAVLKKFCNAENTVPIIEGRLNEGVTVSFRIPLSEKDPSVLRTCKQDVSSEVFSAVNVVLSKIPESIYRDINSI